MSHQRLRTEFADVNALGNQTGFELDFLKLSRGANKVPTTIHQGTKLVAIDLKLDCAYHQRGVTSVGTLAVGIPRCGIRSWCGRHYSLNSILPFNLSTGIDAVSEASFEAYVLVFYQDFLREIAAENRLELPGILEMPRSTEVLGDSEANRQLRRHLQLLMNVDFYQLDDNTEFELALLLLDAAKSPGGPDSDDRVTRTRAVNIALDVIDARLDEPLSVRELCIATGVPARSLSRGFQERFGLGPKAYMNQLRLSRVRNSLIRDPFAAKISDLANQHGFWHLGQFAQDYRKLFGELPSKTAQSASSYATNHSVSTRSDILPLVISGD